MPKPKTLLAPALILEKDEDGKVFSAYQTTRFYKTAEEARVMTNKHFYIWPAPQPNEDGFYEIEVDDENV